eukprot:TRINITY_DN5080_c0_g2_i1.p1 TRINITY_DN5080_c0_g2~~TRINITY_DN5080_c0_g2_i1.p1  ORF type:complete len:295 (+),score=76.29 TRINITY_DN5080_c0_g2_i1:197-1081(+)
MAETREDEVPLLDMARADRSVWLMKCPQIIAQRWQEVTHPGQPLGKITIVVDPLQKNDQPVEKQVEDPAAPPTMVTQAKEQEKPSKDVTNKPKGSMKSEFTMEITAPGSLTAPKCYTLNMNADIVPMYVFSETAHGKVAVDGKVEHKFDMTPHSQNLEDYRKLCRERTSKCNYKTRKVQVLDTERGGFYPMQGMMDFSLIAPKDKKVSSVAMKAQEMKRTRMDRRELENILFKLFEEQSNWTLKQLVTKTDQPEQFLKEILSDLGIYNKRGSNHGTYELKPEYKRSTAENMDAE